MKPLGDAGYTLLKFGHPTPIRGPQTGRKWNGLLSHDTIRRECLNSLVLKNEVTHSHAHDDYELDGV